MSTAPKKKVDEVLQSSFSRDSSVSLPNINPCRNGFVDTVLQAYNQHHALVLRPDDVWLCILSQFSLFVNGEGRVEQLRHLFVTHEDKKELKIVFEPATRYTVDYGVFAQMMIKKIHENVVDPGLRDWKFSTTTLNDTVVASVMMMATLKAYFEYAVGCVACGIPKVTLLGTQEDWSKIFDRVHALEKYGPETMAWAAMLKPILARFAKALDPVYANSEDNLDFWQHGIHYSSGGSGPEYICGWLSAFAVFGDKGQWQGDPAFVKTFVDAESTYDQQEPGERLGQCSPMDYVCGEICVTEERRYGNPKILEIDGVTYHPIDTMNIPRGSVEVEVKIDDNGEIFDGLIVAGLVGMTSEDVIVEGGEIIKAGQIAPVPAWWMLVVSEDTSPRVNPWDEIFKNLDEGTSMPPTIVSRSRSASPA